MLKMRRFQVIPIANRHIFEDMGQEIEIKTDQTVYEFVTVFLNRPNIEMLGEFDSVNYGEGYDFKVQGIQCRLYDESHTHGIEEDNHSLRIEIDRYDNFSSHEQNSVTTALINIISDNGIIAKQ